MQHAQCEAKFYLFALTCKAIHHCGRDCLNRIGVRTGFLVTRSEDGMREWVLRSCHCALEAQLRANIFSRAGTCGHLRVPSTPFSCTISTNPRRQACRCMACNRFWHAIPIPPLSVCLFFFVSIFFRCLLMNCLPGIMPLGTTKASATTRSTTETISQPFQALFKPRRTHHRSTSTQQWTNDLLYSALLKVCRTPDASLNTKPLGPASSPAPPGA